MGFDREMRPWCVGVTILCVIFGTFASGKDEPSDITLPSPVEQEDKSPIAAQPRELPTSEETWTLVGGEALLGRVYKIDPRKNTVTFKEMTSGGTIVDRTFSLDEFSDRNQEFLERYQTGITSGKVIGITDGDTLKILTPAKVVLAIRLLGVDSPERGQPFNKKAKSKLSELTYGQTVTVHLIKRKSFSRFIGTVYNEQNQNVCLEMIKAGFAWHDVEHLSDHTEYATAEAAARESSLGLWVDPKPVAPWDFRHKGKKPKPTQDLIDEGRKIRVMEPRFAQLRRATTSQPKAARISNRVSLLTTLTTKIWEAPKRLARYWMTEGSTKRHNEYCWRFEHSKKGRHCRADEGEPCKLCGG